MELTFNGKVFAYRVPDIINFYYFRDVVAQMLSIVDPVGVHQRSRRRMVRRRYRLKVRLIVHSLSTL